MIPKNMIHLFVVMGLLAASAFAQQQMPPEGGTPKDFQLPAKTELTLENGLQVTMIPFGELPKVTVRLSVRAGNLNEQADQVWLADLTGDLMTEGTENRSALEIAETAAGMGGSVSASVSLDQTLVSGEVLTEFGPQLLELMADIIQNPVFPEDAVERLKNDYQRNLSIAKTRAQSLAQEKFDQAMYGDHPYGRVFPTEAIIQSFNQEMVQKFYQDNFGARRSHLYISGKFDAAAMEKAVQEYFSDWQPGPEPLILPPEPQSERVVYLVDRPGAPQSTLYLGLPVIDPTQPDYLKLQVMNTLLGGYFSSRITSNIREDKGYTYSPRSSITSHYRDAFWRQAADVSTDVTGPALKEIFYEIDRLQNELPTEEELKGVQNYMAGTFVLRNSDPGSIIGQLSFINFHGLPEAYLTEYVKNIHAVTPQDIQEMAQKYLEDSKMTIVVVGDSKKVKKQVRKFGKVKM